MVLAADQSSRPIHEAVLTSNHCQVSFTPGDYPTVLALAKAWAAVPAGQSPDPAKGTVFVFAVDNGRHSVLTKAELENATVRFVRSRRVTTFTVYNLSRGPSLRLDIPVR